MEVNGIFGLIVLLLDVFAIFKIAGSSVSATKRVLWALLVLFLPVVGLVIWFVAGPGDKRFKL
jgi:hypothetical protein